MRKILAGGLVLVFLIGLSACGTAKSEETIAVYKQFAKAVNNKDYKKALALMTPELQGSYAADDNAPLENIKSMSIKKVIKKTGEWKVDTNLSKYYKYEVFYVKVYYRINDTSPSYFKDKSIYHHQIVIVKTTKNAKWKIAETSGAPGMN